MIDLEIHPGISVHEQWQSPEFATCRTCHRSFHPRSEDQLSVELCDPCFEAVRNPGGVTPSVHVKVRPRRSAAL
jgi:hypothetical protein